MVTPGHVIVLVEPSGRLAELTQNDDDYWRNRPTLVWAQATNIGTDIFEDDDELVVWATDLRNGEPLAGVEIDFVGSGETATTNSDGLVRTDKPAGTSADTSRIVARRGDDSALIEANWNRHSARDQSLWYVFDDRQMYRPGETARIKGWVRRLTTSDDAQLARRCLRCQRSLTRRTTGTATRSGRERSMSTLSAASTSRSTFRLAPTWVRPGLG